MRVQPVMADDPCVQVRTWLRPSTFRELTVHAARRRMTLEQLMSKLADAALRPVEWPEPMYTEPPVEGRARRRYLTDAEWAKAQRMRDGGASLSEIAARFGTSMSSVSRRTDARS